PILNKGIGKSNIPKHPVVKHILQKYLLAAQFLFFFFRIVRRIIVSVFLDGREPARLRGVADQQPGDKSNPQGNETRKVKLAFPVGKQGDRHNGERTDESTPYIVRYIPDRHLGSPLFR